MVVARHRDCPKPLRCDTLTLGLLGLAKCRSFVGFCLTLGFHLKGRQVLSTFTLHSRRISSEHMLIQMAHSVAIE